MFDQLFKRPFYIYKHFNAPFLDERIQYIQYYKDNGRSKYTLTEIAQYLLRVIEFLQLEDKDIVTIEEIKEAANQWARFQYNHPQKHQEFSENSYNKFMSYATHWLKTINRLEPLPEEQIPLLNQIFERGHALRRHSTAPLLNERLQYLQFWIDNGAVKSNLRRMAQYLLMIMEYLHFYQVRSITLNEINTAADNWARSKKNRVPSGDYSAFAKARFIYNATDWFKMLGCMEEPIKKSYPFENFLNQYVSYMRDEQGLSENTIDGRIRCLTDFLININEHESSLLNITPLHVDNVLTKKYKTDGYTRRSIQSYASTVRSFLRYAEGRDWCSQHLADTVKAPRVYRYEEIPYSPSWDDVKKILEQNKTGHPTHIRDYAILLILSVYGLRCSEIKHLKLDDLDWKNELLFLRRAKDSKPQVFPLSKPVGKAILNYIQNVRQNISQLRELFLCMRAPYRSMTNPGIYQVVSKNLKPLNLQIKHHGPHALRHACATHLLNEGFTLKEIADHLGHQGLETTRVYTKVDLNNLRKVADFDLGDLL